MYVLKRSRVDPDFIEISEGKRVVLELKVPYKIGRFPPFFSTIEEAKEWLKENERRRVKSYAVFLLAKKSYSIKELKFRLVKKRYSEIAIEECIENFKSMGYLNDEEYFERSILREFEKGKGPRFIAMKLGISIEKVKEKITDEMQTEAVENFFKRGKKSKEKIALELQRKGFDLEIILSNTHL